MVEHTCTRCGKNFPKLWKLRCHNERQYKCQPKVIPQISIPQVKNQEPEAGPGLTTQAYREEQTTIQQVIDQEKKYASEKHFRSIYKVENGIVEKEPPSEDIKF